MIFGNFNPFAGFFGPQAPHITADELADKIKHNSAYLLDIRETDELRSDLGHIKGIKHVPLGLLPSKAGTIANEAGDRDIVIICRSGMRAQGAYRMLEQAGAKKPVVLAGGMISWNSRGHKVTRQVLVPQTEF